MSRCGVNRTTVWSKLVALKSLCSYYLNCMVDLGHGSLEQQSDVQREVGKMERPHRIAGVMRRERLIAAVSGLSIYFNAAIHQIHYPIVRDFSLGIKFGLFSAIAIERSVGDFNHQEYFVAAASGCAGGPLGDPRHVGDGRTCHSGKAKGRLNLYGNTRAKSRGALRHAPVVRQDIHRVAMGIADRAHFTQLTVYQFDSPVTPKHVTPKHVTLEHAIVFIKRQSRDRTHYAEQTNDG